MAKYQISQQDEEGHRVDGVRAYGLGEGMQHRWEEVAEEYHGDQGFGVLAQ